MTGKFFLAVGLLAGTILGAGIFSLPFFVGRLGLPVGFFYLFAFAAIYFSVHLMYAQVILKNEPGWNFFRFAREYFSKPAGIFAGFATLCELSLTLVVYLILAPSFLKLIFNLDRSFLFVAFWVLGSAFVFVKLKWLGLAEFIGVFGIIAAVLLFFGFGNLNFSNLPILPSVSDWSLWLLPFGPLLFALAGRPAITKVVEEYRSARSFGHGFSLKKAIFWGTFLPAAVYAAFIIAVLAVNPLAGSNAAEGLTGFPAAFYPIFGVLGFTAIWTSYLMVGLNLKDILVNDLKWPKLIAGVSVVFLPIVLYVLGIQSFLETIGVAGGVFLALEGIFITAMWRRAFRESKWRAASWALYLVFFAAVAYEVVKYIQ